MVTKRELHIHLPSANGKLALVCLCSFYSGDRQFGHLRYYKKILMVIKKPRKDGKISKRRQITDETLQSFEHAPHTLERWEQTVLWIVNNFILERPGNVILKGLNAQTYFYKYFPGVAKLSIPTVPWYSYRCTSAYNVSRFEWQSCTQGRLRFPNMALWDKFNSTCLSCWAMFPDAKRKTKCWCTGKMWLWITGFKRLQNKKTTKNANSCARCFRIRIFCSWPRN